MTQKTDKPRRGKEPESFDFRQVVISAVALGIIGLGVWSMYNQSAPYHPDTVTRDIGTDLSDFD